MELSQTHTTSESKRLRQSNAGVAHGNRWGPYRSERAWGTVREDDSSYGTAWEYFPHDHARSRVIARARAIAALCLMTTADPDTRGM